MGLTVAAHEHGLIRVFAVNRPPSDVANDLRKMDKDALAQAWIGQPLAAGEVEIIDLRDLAGLGLSGYLADGYTVPQDQLSAARGKLDALDGFVLLVFSAAFDGRAAQLGPTPDVTLIGTFGEQQPDNTPQPMEAEAAAPYTGTPATPQPPAPKSRAMGSVVVAVLAVIALAVLGWAIF